MKKKQHLMVRLVRLLAVVFVLFGCFMVFLYTPFYANIMVKVLNAVVSVDVNEVAAKSQQQAALKTQDEYEPGSRLWIARQAYLQLVEKALVSNDPQDLSLLQARYQRLQQEIRQQKQRQPEEEKPTIPQVISQDATSHVADVTHAASQIPQDASASGVLHTLTEASAVHPVPASETARHTVQSAALAVRGRSDADNKQLMAQYVEYLTTSPVKIETEAEQQSINHQLSQDIAYLNSRNEQAQPSSSVTGLDKKASEPEIRPYAIVLGGGLTLAENQKDIIINKYTRLRLETTLEEEKKNNLPIVLSGVEAPYMQKWLAERHIEANLLENRSMNTCENTRFSSLLLQKKGGAPTVILITDRYHMPRTRRLFALNGIRTIPVEAPMPTQLTTWQPSQQNYDHSRRANYEMLAIIRDSLFGSSSCREVP